LPTGITVAPIRGSLSLALTTLPVTLRASAAKAMVQTAINKNNSFLIVLHKNYTYITLTLFRF
jgi:hypothetical protein